MFDVDVADGQPPLKLPMDRGEDPYEVAERFIAANGLPATYREQIVRFIVQNTAGAALRSGCTCMLAFRLPSSGRRVTV